MASCVKMELARWRTSSWGGIVSAVAAVRSIRGVVTDGACRDVGQAGAEAK